MDYRPLYAVMQVDFVLYYFEQRQLERSDFSHPYSSVTDCVSRRGVFGHIYFQCCGNVIKSVHLGVGEHLSVYHAAR